MTYLGHPRNALEAVLAASRPAPFATPAPPPNGATARQRGGGQVALDRAAVALLARVLTFRPAQGPPIIQIVGCTDGEGPAGVGASLGRTCAVLVGRTLMVEIETMRTGLFGPPASTCPLPDAFLGGLYHHRIGTTAADTDLLYGPLRQQALASLASPFRILVIEAPEPNSGATLALAPLCHCTLLVVRAGLTRLADINSASASIRAAGGRVVGTVLAGSAGSRSARRARRR